MPTGNMFHIRHFNKNHFKNYNGENVWRKTSNFKKKYLAMYKIRNFKKEN